MGPIRALGLPREHSPRRWSYTGSNTRHRSQTNASLISYAAAGHSQIKNIFQFY